MSDSLRDIARAGLWHNNPGLVQLLGLCPLLAVSNTLVKALGLGLATLLVLTLSSLVISLLRRHISAPVRVPVFMLVIGTLVGCVELLMQAYTFALHQALGIFVPLIVSNCVVLARADSHASRQPPLSASIDGLMMGTGFLLLICALGAVRELLGTGALFADFEQLLPFAAGWRIQLWQATVPLLQSPPGAFLLLAGAIALKNFIDSRRARVPAQPVVISAGSKRVRVTGKL